MKMAEGLDLKNIVKHLANGTLSELCLVCLSPLKENTFESIYTLICKEKKVFCVADALMAMCQFEFQGAENYNICCDCFKSTSAAYKLHLQAKQSMEIITYYTEELLNNIKNVEVTNEDMEKLLCIPLSEYVPETCLFDFNLDGIGRKVTGKSNKATDNLIVMVDNEKTSVLNLDSDGKMNQVKTESDDGDDNEEMFMIISEKKERKKRDPMEYMSCSQCPVKYRFVAKLKEHMRVAHHVDIYYCKICKILFEDKGKYEVHLKTHRGRHQCSICHTVYKKVETLEAHMKTHEEEKVLERSENANVCELCGAILGDEASLQDHISSKHVKKYTCYYCGRMYKGEASFESHIQKHEDYWNKKTGAKSEQKMAGKQSEKEANKHNKNKRSVCLTCGKDFVDERSLGWHQRLHNNDRPYTCEACGRGFVTLNRRNQHALCAHTPPQRRCPLCPALFHLRSMVNTHVKKVHLRAHKRRTRKAKHQNVFWRTEPVPIQDLCIEVQNDILELQTAQAEKATARAKKPPVPVSLIYMDGVQETYYTDVDKFEEDL